MNLTFETELEDDGRWIAEVPEIPGCLAYGATELEAMSAAKKLANSAELEIQEQQKFERRRNSFNE
jgi:predicted RNase H-like HicB family nuclease